MTESSEEDKDMMNVERWKGHHSAYCEVFAAATLAQYHDAFCRYQTRRRMGLSGKMMVRVRDVEDETVAPSGSRCQDQS